MATLSQQAVQSVAAAVVGALPFLRAEDTPQADRVAPALDAAWRVQEETAPLERPEKPADQVVALASRESDAGISEPTEHLLLAVATPGQLYSQAVALEVARWLSTELWHEGLCIEYREGRPVVVPILSYPVGVAFFLSRKGKYPFRVDMNSEFSQLEPEHQTFRAMMRPAGFEPVNRKDGETEFASLYGPLVLPAGMFEAMAAQVPAPIHAGPFVGDEALRRQLDESHRRLEVFLSDRPAPAMDRQRVGLLDVDIVESTSLLFSTAPARAARTFAAFLSEVTAIVLERTGSLYQLGGDGALYMFPAEADESVAVDWMVHAAELIQHVMGDTLARHLAAEGLPGIQCRCALDIGDVARLAVTDGEAASFGDVFYIVQGLSKSGGAGEILLGAQAARCAPGSVQHRLTPDTQRRCYVYWYPLKSRQILQ